MGAYPPFLAGRDSELDYFDEMLLQLSAGGTQKHLVLTGLRGVGKTVLLNAFEERCEAAGWTGETREIADGSSIAHVVARAARKGLMEMSARKRAAAAVRRGLRVLKAFTMTLGDLSFRFDVEAMDGIADSGDLGEDMRDLLVEVGTAARASGTGFALILDEMQNLSKADLEALIVGLHRAKQKALPLALVGGGLPLLPDLTGEAKSYAERGFEFRRIGALDKAAVAAALVEPTRDQGVRWDSGAIDRVIELTEGYPYFLQEYGREVWRVRRGGVIDAGQVSAVEPIVLAYLDDNFFSQRIGKPPDGERRYLSAMAALGDGPQRSGEIAAFLGKRPEELSAIRERLIKASLIYSPARGELDFTVPMCADHIRRHPYPPSAVVQA